MFQNRKYQDDAVSKTEKYWITHPGKAPLIVLPTGSGKSVVIADLCNLMQTKYFSYNPRGIITVPSKELCIQNAEKLRKILPPNVSVGIYSASVGVKQPNNDIVVATIGSVRKYPEELGYRSYWINDECHLASSNGTGSYWQFLNGMDAINKKLNTPYCYVGLTATPFKGNGVFITDGKKPMYRGIAHETKMSELLMAGYLSPLVNPQSSVSTRIDTSNIKMSGDDFNIADLSERTKEYLYSCAMEAKVLAAERKKWMAFLPDVSSANDFCKILNSLEVTAAVVTGDTPSAERERLIEQFKNGYIRCLITVIALTTGFDVPDIDCILWMRSTHSLVLYVQGAGRGTRTAPGKENCMWIDFTDTTERLGAVDQVKGRPASRNIKKATAPCIICENCGEQWTPASKEVCIEYYRNEKGAFILDESGARIQIAGCGHVMRVPDPLDPRYASSAEIMATVNPYPEFPVSEITAKVLKSKIGKDYIRIEFFSGMNKVADHNIYFGVIGMTQESAIWWRLLTGDNMLHHNSVTACMNFISNQTIFNKSLGINSIILDRTQNAKYPKLKEVIR
ncbi:putative ATP-dependent helicase [Serratia phage vB_SmaS_Stoker]|uniref:ATP-dependent helicase n=1 Tax=Serratia phage vB_SmaS_Stoker TaxID=2902692 RepID=A0AC61TQF8_9CAUD|nr:ATP-dependent helicase [Serratia phage vB_SmaS_Bonzee]YP_010774222.1 putative ATP-dependent helicase [Serratia phage vB_SmaS_Stoker]UGO53788.1 putative ATP-dependent helicase [Serratia phage vB_SmaS_Stoker]UKL15186.1 ATP-dependent helicase [Serratia phage vB_SmaS_Bonzee]